MPYVWLMGFNQPSLSMERTCVYLIRVPPRLYATVRTKPIATMKVTAPPKAASKDASAAAATPRPTAQYDAEQVGTAGVASIFAGTFLLTLAGRVRFVHSSTHSFIRPTLKRPSTEVEYTRAPYTVGHWW